MADVTAIILTKDEEKNLPDCLKSIQNFAQRAIVVDSGSTDRTCEIAREMGAEVLVHPFENYARQFNWGVNTANVQTEWILRLDADERFPDSLNQKLESVLANPQNADANGIMLESDFYFLGRKIRFGGPKKRKIMLYRSGYGRIENRRMDEHTIVDGRVISLKERFEHRDFKDLDTFIAKMNWYATREMQDYFEDKNAIQNSAELSDKHLIALRKKKFGIYYRFPMFLRCQLLFIYNYIFRLGFLDGREGFIYHWLYQRWYRTLVDAKIYEQMKFPKPFEATGALGATSLPEEKNEKNI